MIKAHHLFLGNVTSDGELSTLIALTDDSLVTVTDNVGGRHMVRKRALSDFSDPEIEDVEPLGLNALAIKCHATAVEKGWYDQENPIERKLLNLVSEVTEAWGEWVNGHELTEIYYVDGKPEGFPIELADLIIRAVDLVVDQGIDLDEAVRIKMKYNKTRPYRHGGKRA